MAEAIAVLAFGVAIWLWWADLVIGALLVAVTVASKLPRWLAGPLAVAAVSGALVAMRAVYGKGDDGDGK